MPVWIIQLESDGISLIGMIRDTHATHTVGDDGFRGRNNSPDNDIYPTTHIANNPSSKYPIAQIRINRGNVMERIAQLLANINILIRFSSLNRWYIVLNIIKNLKKIILTLWMSYTRPACSMRDRWLSISPCQNNNNGCAMLPVLDLSTMTRYFEIARFGNQKLMKCWHVYFQGSAQWITVSHMSFHTNWTTLTSWTSFVIVVLIREFPARKLYENNIPKNAGMVNRLINIQSTTWNETWEKWQHQWATDKNLNELNEITAANSLILG